MALIPRTTYFRVSFIGSRGLKRKDESSKCKGCIGLLFFSLTLFIVVYSDPTSLEKTELEKKRAGDEQ
jgi:hypothetical protein